MASSELNDVVNEVFEISGFSCLESGLVRSKNSINVAAKNFADFCLSSAVFWLFGFALMFGATSGGFFGTSGFLFNDTANPWLMAFFIFQLGFCGTAVTIVSGAVSERMRFAGYLVVATILSAVIYPFIGHWVWGSASGAAPGGWLEQRGFIDFAGSTVVHSVGGWVALAAIIIIGPRIGRFGENSIPIHGHDLPFVTLGVFLLWFGWFGFNGGSTLGLTPEVPTIIVNTTVSGAFGGIVGMALAWRLGGRPDVTMIMNGSLAGLVGITASAHIMTPVAAAGIGSIAAAMMYSVAMLLEKLEIDDVVGAVPVHLAAGIWGTLAVAIFGDPEAWGTGLGRWEQLAVQATGVGAAFLWAFGLGFILLWLINRVYPLRIGPEGEQVGLNVAEHGASTEILDLLTEMDAQRRANDFSQPVNVEPHTEIGQIAQQYNRVITDINAEQRRREAATEALRQQTLSLELLQEAAVAANQAKTIEDAIRTCLEDISSFGGWAVGHCYMLHDATGELASAKIWHFDDAERFATFREVTENTTFKSGVGLPGRVMASGDAAWVVDISEDPNFLRGRNAEDLGVKGAAAFPVLVEEDVVAVLEFFSREPVEPNETMLEVMASVGAQLGRVVERRRSEAARFKSVVDNMPAHVHLRDRSGRYILINRKYEEFYGVTNDFVRGKTLDEVHQFEQFEIDLGGVGVHDREVIENNSVVEDNYTITRKGVAHTMADVKFPVRDHSGEIIAVGGIELDITELKRAEQALREKTEFLQLTEVITRAANEAVSVKAVMQLALDQVCAHTGWPVGHLYTFDVSTGDLVPGGIWHIDDTEKFATFRRVTEATRFAKGVGLPGRVLASGDPTWIEDVTKDPNFRRALLATDLGVKGSFAFPVLLGREVAAVLEFFSEEAAEPYAPLLEVMAQIGTQLGRVIERKRAEERASAEFLRIEEELQSARELQSAMLPQQFSPPTPQRPVKCAAVMQPAREVGGDFYDVIDLDERRLGIVIADVAGKGAGAALFMARAFTILDSTARRGGGPGEVLAHLNDLLCVNNDKFIFVTVFYGIFDGSSGTLTFANAGHNPPFLIRADRSVEPLQLTGGVAVGVKPNLEYRERSIEIRPGDTAFCYTDGITEAKNSSNEEFSVTNLEKVLVDCAQVPVEDIAGRVIEEVNEFTEHAPPFDDMTCVVMRQIMDGHA